jgi:hypothetical protein
MNQIYSLQRYSLGWLVIAPTGQSGISIDSITEIIDIASLKEERDCYFFPGIAHHYNEKLSTQTVVLVIAAIDKGEQWRADITDELLNKTHLSDEARWWLGVDVGKSSATIFGVLASDRFYGDKAKAYANGATPSDDSDYERCTNLLTIFPEWKDRLSEVVSQYPQWEEAAKRLNV